MNTLSKYSLTAFLSAIILLPFLLFSIVDPTYWLLEKVLITTALVAFFLSGRVNEKAGPIGSRFPLIVAIVFLILGFIAFFVVGPF